jgi:hypothetical protein
MAPVVAQKLALPRSADSIARADWRIFAPIGSSPPGVVVRTWPRTGKSCAMPRAASSAREARIPVAGELREVAQRDRPVPSATEVVDSELRVDARACFLRLRCRRETRTQEGGGFLFKPRYSTFDHTSLILLLQDLGVERVLLSGGGDRGVRRPDWHRRSRARPESVLLADACANNDPELEQVALTHAERPRRDLRATHRRHRLESRHQAAQRDPIATVVCPTTRICMCAVLDEFAEHVVGGRLCLLDERGCALTGNDRVIGTALRCNLAAVRVDRSECENRAACSSARGDCLASRR